MSIRTTTSLIVLILVMATASRDILASSPSGMGPSRSRGGRRAQLPTANPIRGGLATLPPRDHGGNCGSTLALHDYGHVPLPRAPSEATPQATPVTGVEAGPVAPSDPQATITGTQEVHVVNDTGDSLSDLYLRLYPQPSPVW